MSLAFRRLIRTVVAHLGHTAIEGGPRDCERIGGSVG